MKARWCLVFCCAALQAQGVITTFAGTSWVFPGNGKPAINAPLGNINALTVDPAGNPVVSDNDNCILARVGSDGILTVLAGNGTCIGQFGISGDGGPATSASIGHVFSAGFDLQGNLYVITAGRIRKVTADGIIRPFAGTGQPGFSGDGGLAATAQINPLSGFAVDAASNLYFAEPFNYRIRKITPTGIISTFAGNGSPVSSGDGGLATDAGLLQPMGLAFDRSGSLFISEPNPSRIRKITNGVISAVLGKPFQLSSPGSLAFDGAGALYIGCFESVYKAAPGAAAAVLFAGDPQAPDGFSGDGGRALSAHFSGYVSVATGKNGELYIGDQNNDRVRKVTPDGLVGTIAGNGAYRYSGDGGPASAATLNRPGRLAIDAAGNLYISEVTSLFAAGGLRVRKVTAGTISTFFASGKAVLAFDAAGNMYVNDLQNGLTKISPGGTVIATFPVRATVLAVAPNADLFFPGQSGTVSKIDAKGKQTVYAGTVKPGFSGDGGPATSAQLGTVTGLALDKAGNLYISDFDNNRVRKVTPLGVISTFAGNGMHDFAPKPGPALQVATGSPQGLVFDPAGNLFIACEDGVVLKVTPDGFTSTFAGGGPPDQIGDGRIATAASLFPTDLVFDAAGNLYISDGATQRVRVVLVAAPTMSAAPDSLSFTAASGGAPVSQTLTVQGSLAGLDFQVVVDTGGSGNWLSADVSSGVTPRVLTFTANPANLAPGPYSATITINPAAALPASLPVTVTFQVGAPLPPQLNLDKPNLSLTFPQGASRRSSTLNLSNLGGGIINFTASALTSSGGQWLVVAPSSGKVSPGQPAALTITADPAGLQPGTYTGSVTIQTDVAGSVILPVTITLSSLPQALLLTQAGLAFTAVVQGGVVPSQSFGVVNTGTGVLNWTVATSTLAGGANWLSATPQSGSSDASAAAPQISVSVNPAGLAAGNYYGLVRLNAPGAANTPQVVTVFLEVLPQGSDPGAMVQPQELVFPYFSGVFPGSLTLLVYNVGAGAKTFRTVHADTRIPFLAIPEEGVLDPNQPARILLQPLSSFRTTSSTALTFQFSDGRVRTVKLTFVPAGPDAPNPTGAQREAGCAPTKLLPAVTTLGQSFAVSAGWPVALSVDVRDDCGTAHVAGSVTVSFSDGESPLSLQSLKDGTWQATWQTRSSSLSHVTLSVDAVNPQLQISGSRQVDGAFSSQKDPPVLTSGSVGSAASFVPYAALAPGGIISIYGDRLADNTAANQGLPLPTKLGNAQVLIAGQAMPLFYVSQTQVNALVPFGINPNTTHQILVQRGLTYSQPIPVDVGPAQPAAFLTGGKYAIAVAYRGNDTFLVTSSTPATANDVLVIYCAGLGATDPQAMDGAASPSSPAAQTKAPVTVTIGGQNAPVSFAGLTPGLVGLYQINAVVPAGTATGDAVPLTLMVAGQTGPSSALPVR